MRVRNRRDFWSGAMFSVFGVAFVISSQEYEMGTPARMGPGFFPAMLGVLLALLGLAVIWRSAARGAERARVDAIGWRKPIRILVSILLFALALPYLGMVVAIALLIGVGASASHEFRWKETLVSIVILLALSWLVFVRGLALQFPVWPTFLVR